MTFKCHACGKPIHTTLHSLDRRVQSQAIAEVDGRVQTILHIHQADTVLLHDSLECRASHEPGVIEHLRLKTPYPPAGIVVPCSRCGAPVVRTAPHVGYAWVTLELHGAQALTGHCTDDQDLAVLCPHCEPPGAAAAEEIDERTRERPVS